MTTTNMFLNFGGKWDSPPLRMPLGLKSEPAAFQRCMLNTLSHLPGYSAAYIDDIIIYSPNCKHIDNIWQYWMPLE